VVHPYICGACFYGKFDVLYIKTGGLYVKKSSLGVILILNNTQFVVFEGFICKNLGFRCKKSNLGVILILNNRGNGPK
jgi:hypothetical protein